MASKTKTTSTSTSTTTTTKLTSRRQMNTQILMPLNTYNLWFYDSNEEWNYAVLLLLSSFIVVLVLSNFSNRPVQNRTTATFWRSELLQKDSKIIIPVVNNDTKKITAIKER